MNAATQATYTAGDLSALTRAHVLDLAVAVMATARLTVRVKAPYFSIGLTKLVPVPRWGLGTIGVSANGVLIFDPIFIVVQGLAKVAGLPVHEVLHVLDNHSGRRGTRDPRRWNINADRSINTIVRDCGFELPCGKDEGCWPRDLGPGTPEGLMAEQYYDLDEQQRAEEKAKRDAAKAKQTPPPPPPPSKDESDDDTSEEPGEEPAGEDGDGAQGEEPGEDGDGDDADGDESSDDEGGDEDGDGEGTGEGEGAGGSDADDDASEPSGEGSGSGPGEDGDDASAEGEGEGDDDATAEDEGVGRGHCGSCAGNALEDEVNIDPADKRSEAEMARIAKQVAQAIQEHGASGRGNMPKGLLLLANAVNAPAKVSWQQKLQHAVKRAARVRTGANVYRFDGPSKRQGGIGYGVGRALMPRPRAVVPNVAIMIDTSGSMGQSELTAALREAGACIKALGAPVLYGTCDAAVHTLQKVQNASDLAKLLKGGGGTSFVPAFAALDALKGDKRPELVVFITDGGGDAPAKPPAGMSVIWLLVGAHRCKPWVAGDYSNRIAWGEFIEVDD